MNFLRNISPRHISTIPNSKKMPKKSSKRVRRENWEKPKNYKEPQLELQQCRLAQIPELTEISFVLVKTY